MFTIYKITNTINNFFYIGYTSQLVEKRWRQHCTNGSVKMPIYNAICKYSSENFVVETVETYSNKSEATTREIELIEKLRPQYNIHPGGTGGPMYGPMNGMYGKKHSDEWKKNKSNQMTGPNNPIYGKPRPECVKRKISESKKGKPSSRKGAKAHPNSVEAASKPKTESMKQKLRNTYSVDGMVVTNAKQYCAEMGYNYILFTQAAVRNKIYKGHIISRIAA